MVYMGTCPHLVTHVALEHAHTWSSMWPRSPPTPGHLHTPHMAFVSLGQWQSQGWQETAHALPGGSLTWWVPRVGPQTRQGLGRDQSASPRKSFPNCLARCPHCPLMMLSAVADQNLILPGRSWRGASHCCRQRTGGAPCALHTGVGEACEAHMGDGAR